MMVKDKTTEQKIFEAARIVFQKKGLAGARMQEIADEAGINKALLHYYFRTKEKLFEAIFSEVFTNISSGLEQLFKTEMVVIDRFRFIVDIYIENLLKNRQIPLFVINEMNQNPEKIQILIEQKIVVYLKNFMIQVQQEMHNGKIKKVNPFHFLMSVLSMTIFPFIAYPVIKGIAEKNMQISIESFYHERKKVIFDFIENTLKP
jgi:TetR/AcrR family transcriptional regulator